MLFPHSSTVIWGAPRVVAGTPIFVARAPWLIAGDPGCFQTCCWRSQACRQCSQMLPDAPKVLSGLPRCSQTSHTQSHSTPVPVIKDPSYSEGRQECPPRVWYCPEIDASKFTLHILSNTSGGFQWLKYIFLMQLSNSYRHVRFKIFEHLIAGGYDLFQKINMSLLVIWATFLYKSSSMLGGLQWM